MNSALRAIIVTGMGACVASAVIPSAHAGTSLQAAPAAVSDQAASIAANPWKCRSDRGLKMCIKREKGGWLTVRVSSSSRTYRGKVVASAATKKKNSYTVRSKKTLVSDLILPMGMTATTRRFKCPKNATWVSAGYNTHVGTRIVVTPWIKCR